MENHENAISQYFAKKADEGVVNHYYNVWSHK